jgi:hypothetical protein
LFVSLLNIGLLFASYSTTSASKRYLLLSE